MPTAEPSTSMPKASIAAILTAVLTVILVASQSTDALIILLVDGLSAVLILIVATLAGTWVTPLLRLDPLPLRWRLLIGAGVGILALSTLVLVLGTLGCLARATWLTILVVLGIAAVAALARISQSPVRAKPDIPSTVSPWLWLSVAPFLAMTLLVAVVPPGFLWVEEGGGYDVLEYHLQLPKEYVEQGAITYTPHNVYGNFPANVEMLYLLTMVLRDDPYDGAATAKILNALLGALFVFAAYVAGRETSRTVGVVTAVVAASVGWLTYLSGVAFVENGMLLFAMIALVCAMRASNPSTRPDQRRTWLILSGLMTGAACGCKYTAVPLVAVPIGAAFALWPNPPLASRIRAGAVFGLTVLLGFAPWLVKNTAMTGNPVFPLLSPDCDDQPPGWGEREAWHFDACHAPGPGEFTFAARMQRLWRHIPADPVQRFGPLILILPFLRLLSRKRQLLDRRLALVAALQLILWLYLTHLYARFAVPMIVPLVVLAGRAFEVWSSAVARRALTAVLIVGAGVSAFAMATHYADHLYHDGSKLPLEGADRFFLDGLGAGHEHLAVINGSLPDDAKILMIGDAKALYFRRPVDYCVVFNRNPFIEVVRTAHDDQSIVAWLTDAGYTHVLVNWAETSRLRNSRYGFPDVIQPDLFIRLSQRGLTWLGTFATGDPPKPYATFYAVPR